ncbi:MAG: hypothetical protein AB7S83_05160 [Candidatus Methanomethylophilaceae archaeon]|jgi:hypothetical protein
MLVGRSLYALGRYDEADVSLSDTIKKFIETGDISRLDEMMVLRAGTAYARGDRDGCLSILGKALASCRNESRREGIHTLTDAVRSGKGFPVFD